MAVVGLAVGAVAYSISRPLPIGESGKLFLCGEDEGVLPRAQAHATGTHFLLTEFLEKAKGFYGLTNFDRAFYALARAFDLSCRVFAKTHTGKLWVYMVWVLAGVVILLALFLLAG